MLVDLPNSADDVREKVLEAAVELLAEHGLRRLTQPQVAEQAGVRQSHVTYYFPRRSDLINAVARRYVESAGLEMMQLFQEAESEDLEALLTTFAQKQVTNRRRVRTMVGLLVASEEDPALREQLVQAVLGLRSVIAHVLGVPVGDPAATIMQATLWGLGVNNLLTSGTEESEVKDLVTRAAATLKPALQRRWPPSAPKAKAKAKKKQTKASRKTPGARRA